MKDLHFAKITLVHAIAILIAGVAVSVSAPARGSEITPIHLVKDINPGSAGSDASQFVTLNGVAYFRADDGPHGYELWRTDGTEAGTQLVVDLRTGMPNGFPDNITVANGSLYFNGFNTPAAEGSKVWRSDGTAAGTQLLADTYPDLIGGGGFGPPLPGGFTALNASLVLFSALDPDNYLEPWRTDGTPAGTMRLIDLHPRPEGSVPVGFTVLHDVAYFTADDSVVINDDGTAIYNRELFRTDGTAAGTYRVKDINPGPEPSIPFGLIRRGEYLYFSANDGAHGTELWRTDGTDFGTAQVADINPGPDGSGPEHFILASLRMSKAIPLVFAADDGTHGSEIFLSNGTAATTRLIKDVNPTSDSVPLSLTAFQGNVYFNADDGVHGREPWVTDGTEAGTRLFMDLNPGEATSRTVGLHRGGG